MFKKLPLKPLYLALVLLVALTFCGWPAAQAQVQAQTPAARRTPFRWGYYVGQGSSLDSLRANIDSLTHISPFYFVLRADGTISGNDQPEVNGLAHSRGVKVLPMLQNDQRTAAREVLHNLLSDPAKVRLMVDAIEAQVLGYGYDGYHIDFEDVLGEDRPYLTGFISQLYARLHPRGKLVTMAVVAKYRDVTSGWGGSYDYAGLTPYLDLAVTMTYDFHYSGGPDGPVAPINWVSSVAAYAASQFGPGKVLLGVPFYGYDWNLTRGGNAGAHGYDGFLELVRLNKGTIGYDEVTQQSFVDYTENGDQHRGWFETPRGLAAKLDVIKKNNLAGFAAWRLGQEGRDFWPVIKGWQ